MILQGLVCPRTQDVDLHGQVRLAQRFYQGTRDRAIPDITPAGGASSYDEQIDCGGRTNAGIDGRWVQIFAYHGCLQGQRQP